jgi:hypothetical protein
MMKNIGFPDIWVRCLKLVFFSGAGSNFYRTVGVDPGHFPELIHYVVILFAMFKRKNLLCPGTGTKRAFRFMVNNGIADPELYHLDLLSGVISGI